MCVCLHPLPFPHSSINQRNYRGFTALHLAAEHNLTKCVEVLMYYGARTDVQDRKGRTAYKLAIEMGLDNPRMTTMLQG
jgi:ankyrin repeat protein